MEWLDEPLLFWSKEETLTSARMALYWFCDDWSSILRSYGYA